MDINREIIESYFVQPHQVKINVEKLFKEEKTENIENFIKKKIKPEINFLIKKGEKHEYINTLDKLLIKGKYKKRKTYKKIMEEFTAKKPHEKEKEREKLKNKLMKVVKEKVEKI